MDFDQYQYRAKSSAVYPEEYKVIYPALGLADEAGETVGKVKKWLRGDNGLVANPNAVDQETRDAIIGEMGDVLWYLAALAGDLHVDLDFVAQENLRKLASRVARGVVKGSGDNR